MKFKYVIWDWNGTLFDDVKLSIDAMNGMLEIGGYPQRHNAKSYREVFCFPIIEYYRRVGFDFEKHPFSQLAQQFIDLYEPAHKKAKLYEGAEEVLEKLEKAGTVQTIISACEKKRLNTQIDFFGIRKYLENVLGIDDNYANSKVLLAQEWIKEKQIDPHDVVFIGDTGHDFEVASALGCECILVSKGHQCRELLEKNGAAVIEDIADAVDLIL